ncbi:MAG: hypothetical protein QGH74_04100, partial [Candidatus Brocadiia bacterium]|nr:hypothetical protein [Candidatus Brocadiia bacterium]
EANVETEGRKPVWRAQLVLCAMAALSVGYLMLIRTPMRLTPDVLNYLSMAQSAAEGNGFLVRGSETHFPPGYPAMLAALDLAGLGVNWAFVALNCVFLAVALPAAYYVLRKAYGFEPWLALLACCMTMLSYVCMMHVATPLSDVSFMGVSMAALAAIVAAERSTGRRRWCLAALALLMCGAATAIRTVGVALLPALLWACSARGRTVPDVIQYLRGNRRLLAALSALALLVGVAGTVLMTRTRYFDEMAEKYRDRGFVPMALQTLDYRVSEFGQMATNAWRWKVLPYMKIIGAFTIGLTLFGLWQRRPSFRAADVYVLFFMVIMAVWPYRDGRFWLPIMPLIFGMLALTFRALVSRLAPKVGVLTALAIKVGIVAVLVNYSLRGTFWMGEHLILSVSGRYDFPEIYYYRQRYGPTYRKAFGSDQPVDESKVHKVALRMLQRYEPLARQPEEE